MNKNKEKGRKKLTKYHVFNNEKYLSILFLIYRCRSENIKCKKQQLKKVLVNLDWTNLKKNDPSFEKVARHVAYWLNAHIGLKKFKEYDEGDISKDELDKWVDQNTISEQYLYDNRFKNVYHLSKYLTYLKKLGLIENKKIKNKYPSWDFTQYGLKEFENNFLTRFKLDVIFDSNSEYHIEKVKNFIDLTYLEVFKN